MIYLIVLLSCLTYLIVIMRDLFWLSRYLNKLSTDTDKGSLRCYLFSPWSSIGKSLLNKSSRLQIIIDCSNWRAERFKREINPVKEDALLKDTSDLNIEVNSDSFYARFLRLLSTKFRCKIGAFIIYDESSESSISIHLSSDTKTGRTNKNLELALKHFYGPVFKEGESWQFGLRDGYQSSSLFREFSTFGYRYSLSYPILVSNENGYHKKGVLWLGYSSDKPPIKEEELWLKQLTTDFQQRFSSTQKILDLSTRVASAKRSDEERRQFMAHASHDIRSPLNNLKAILSLYALEESKEGSKELIDAALNSCSQMAEIVDDILDFSRHQSGQLKANPKLIDFSNCLEEVIDLHRVAAKIKGLDFEISDYMPPYQIMGDKLQIKRVINNLISNAIKYTNSGRISIRFELVSNSSIRLSVQDSGVGISAADQGRLFSPFTRFGRSNEDGVGLGLALSKVLVELNNGKLEVSSDLGKGSCFFVTFDLIHQVVNPLSLSEYNIDSPVDLLERYSFREILVVDDDSRCVDALSRNLERLGVKVIKAHSVNQAINIINHQSPCAVISDLNMPDGGGGRIASYVKQNGYLMPVLLLTGYVDSNEIILLKEAGASEVYIKNIEFFEIENWLKANIFGMQSCAGAQLESLRAIAS